MGTPPQAALTADPGNRRDAVRLLARLRWVATVLIATQVFLDESPPLGGSASILLGAGLLGASNIPAALSGRFSAAGVERVARWGLCADVLACAIWTFLDAIDPHSTAYVIFILVGVEAAFLYGTRGTIPVLAVFLIAQGGTYWLRASALGVQMGPGSIVFRLSIVVVATLFTGLLADQVERHRRAALRASEVAHRQSEVAQQRSDELRRSLQVIEVARDEAERATRAKSEYLSRMSHELRTPLTAILGFSELLAMDDPREDQRDAIDAVSRSGAHLRSLIDDVLDISRIESGRQEMQIEEVALGVAIDEAVTLLSTTAREDGVAVHIRFHEVAPSRAYVRADRSGLRQVVVNLLSNAIKYNHRGGSVTITVTPDGKDETLRLAVADTGVGIPGDRVGSIFEPFERVGASRFGVQGSGLGLTLVRDLVRAMGGSIAVTSEPGRGSTFTVDLPRARAQAEGATETA